MRHAFGALVKNRLDNVRQSKIIAESEMFPPLERFALRQSPYPNCKHPQLNAFRHLTG